MHVIHTLRGDGQYAMALRFSPDGQYLISAGMNGHLHLWATHDWSHVKQITGHWKSVNAVILDHDGARIATGSSDCTIRIWSFPEFKLLHEVQDRKKTVAGMAVAHKAHAFAACAYGGRVAVWDFAGAFQIGFRASDRNLAAVAFAPDDRSILTGGLGGALTRWSLPDGEPLGTIEAHAIALSRCAYLPDGDRVLTLGYDGFLKLWDARNWTLLQAARIHDDRITGAWFDLARQQVLVLSAGLVRLYALACWDYVDELALDAHVLPCGILSPDGTTVVIGSADARFHVIDLA